MTYRYRVLSRGISSFSGNLESFAGVLEELLNSDELQRLTVAGWEVWRIEKFDVHQGNKGWLVILRRAA